MMAATCKLGGVWESGSGYKVALVSGVIRQAGAHGDGVVSVAAEIEQRARAMTRGERGDFLRSRGWVRLSGRRAECWTRPGYDGTFTLGLATRLTLMDRTLDE